MTRKKPGDRQIADGRKFKEATGSSPNGVANSYLSKLRGQSVVLKHGEIELEGRLLSFDSYSLLIDDDELGETLVFKGPGLVVFLSENLAVPVVDSDGSN